MTSEIVDIDEVLTALDLIEDEWINECFRIEPDMWFIKNLAKRGLDFEDAEDGELEG